MSYPITSVDPCEGTYPDDEAYAATYDEPEPDPDACAERAQAIYIATTTMSKATRTEMCEFLSELNPRALAMLVDLLRNN